jgi:hypothetical protein
MVKLQVACAWSRGSAIRPGDDGDRDGSIVGGIEAAGRGDADGHRGVVKRPAPASLDHATQQYARATVAIRIDQL